MISAWETCDLIYPFVPLPRHVFLCYAGVESERGIFTVVGCKAAGSSRALLTCVLKVMLPIRQSLFTHLTAASLCWMH